MSREAELIGALEPAQLTAATERALPRRKLGRGMTALLIALRLYIFIAVAIVGYAFVEALTR
ncbi:MAG TPA: hypothetical protein VKV96_04230 [Roseiarcus sp.]|nr:hypothetical protein [Roseiarcus sp.]